MRPAFRRTDTTLRVDYENPEQTDEGVSTAASAKPSNDIFRVNDVGPDAVSVRS